jgi:hypothetical protein
MVFRRTRRGGPRASGSTTSRSFAERSRAQNARYVEISFDIVRALDKRLEIAAVDDLGFSPAEVARLQANAFRRRRDAGGHARRRPGRDRGAGAGDRAREGVESSRRGGQV